MGGGAGCPRNKSLESYLRRLAGPVVKGVDPRPGEKMTRRVSGGCRCRSAAAIGASTPVHDTPANLHCQIASSAWTVWPPEIKAMSVVTSMPHQHRQIGVVEHVTGDTAEDEFPQGAVGVGAHHQHVC